MHGSGTTSACGSTITSTCKYCYNLTQGTRALNLSLTLSVNRPYLDPDGGDLHQTCVTDGNTGAYNGTAPVCTLMTTNQLPGVMREPRRRDNEEDFQYFERRNNYMAMVTRCKLTEIKKSHKNKERFPYTADQLALYMQHLCNVIQPIIEDEYVDNQAEE